MDWFRRVILRERRKVRAGHSVPIVFELGADEYFVHGADADLSTEERLDALKKNVDAIHERITKIGKETEKRIFQLEDLVREEKRTRQSETKKIHEKIETTGTSALPISAIGAIWLVCGVTLSTLSAEISWYMR